MKYQFEILSSQASEAEVCVGCMFEEEGISPLAYLHHYAEKHFGPSGPGRLGDRLDMYRYPIEERAPGEDSRFCSAAFDLVDGRPTIRMIAGPVIKKEIDIRSA